MLRPGTMAICAALMGFAGLGLPSRIYQMPSRGENVRIAEWGASRCEAVVLSLVLAPCAVAGPFRFARGSRPTSSVLVFLAGGVSAILGILMLTFSALDPNNDAGIGIYLQTGGAFAAIADGVLGLLRPRPEGRFSWLMIFGLSLILVLLMIGYGSGVIRA